MGVLLRMVPCCQQLNWKSVYLSIHLRMKYLFRLIKPRKIMMVKTEHTGLQSAAMPLMMKSSAAEVWFSLVLCPFCWTKNWTKGPVQASGWTLNWTLVQVQFRSSSGSNFGSGLNFGSTNEAPGSIYGSDGEELMSETEWGHELVSMSVFTLP